MTKRKPVVVTLLILAATFIWGYNAWQVFEVITPQETVSSDLLDRSSIQTWDMPQPKEMHVYRPSRRDPFVSHLTRAPLDIPQNNPPPRVEQIHLPPLFYKGMIGNTAVILDDNGDQFFLTPGEHFGEVKLVLIEAEHIKVEYKGKLFDVTLN